MKTDFSLLVLAAIVGAMFGVVLYLASDDLREQALQKISYFKDQKGNCYAYQPNTPKFSWIPCELTK